jgi:hypothetical protein
VGDERMPTGSSKQEWWRTEYFARAKKMWCCDYTAFLNEEREEDPVLWKTTAMLFGSQTSSYRQRLPDTRLVHRYDLKEEKQIRDTVAVLRT